ncbi:MAG TPA: anti-sigma factor [Pyrinomonadaceae bacterium]|jgi:anti-sigma factor RsiW
MKCEAVCAALEEYFDGELDERQARAVNAHLAACAGCAAEHAALRREHELLMRYERDVEVTPQLWQGVAARIAAERTDAAEHAAPAEPFTRRLRAWFAGALTVPRFSPALTAALILVAVALTVGAMKLTDRHEGKTVAYVPPPPAPQPGAQPTNANVATPAPAPSTEPAPEAAHETVAAAAPKRDTPRRDVRSNESANRSLPARGGAAQFQQAAATSAEPTAEALVREAEAKYLKAIEILSRDVNRRRATLDPQTLARFDETLQAIDRTIAETRRAALTRGNDPVAVQYMLTAYEKKVDVLRELARAD